MSTPLEHDELTASFGAPISGDLLDQVLAGLTTQRACVVCGCTGGRACAGGCAWASLDPAVCTSCKRGGFIDTLGGLL